MRNTLIGLAVLSLSACAGSNPVIDAAPAGPTQASMQKAYLAMRSALVTAVNSGTSRLGSRPGGAAPSLVRPEASVTIPVFHQFESRTPCAGGGVASVSVTMSGSLTATESSVFGSIGWSGNASMIGCSDGTWTTDSNPALTMTGTLTVDAGHLSMNIALGGGWSMSGAGNGAASCQLSGVRMQWDTLSGWSNSGIILCSPGGAFRL